jgi:hypothetical protein
VRAHGFCIRAALQRGEAQVRALIPGDRIAPRCTWHTMLIIA